jgi:hypothetical protein
MLEGEHLGNEINLKARITPLAAFLRRELGVRRHFLSGGAAADMASREIGNCPYLAAPNAPTRFGFRW